MEGGAPTPGRQTDQEGKEGSERVQARQLSTLTRQQLRVLLLLAEGNTNRDIAEAMALTVATVKAHVTTIFRKLNCERRTQAAVLTQRLLQRFAGSRRAS